MIKERLFSLSGNQFDKIAKSCEMYLENGFEPRKSCQVVLKCFTPGQYIMLNHTSRL